MKPNSQDDTESKSIVLVAIDFSHAARDVLATASKLARSSGSELHVVHVLPIAADGAARGEGVLRFSNLADDVRAKLAQLAAEVPDAVKRIDLHVRTGKADVEIAQLASDVGADVIVVGTHSRTGLDRIMLGSVSESLVRNTACSVFVCRAKSVPPWEKIAPPCPDCLAVRNASNRTRLWCERHAEHHGRPHTYSEVPASYGIGSQTFR